MSGKNNQTFWDAYCAAVWEMLVGSALIILVGIGAFLLPLAAGYAVAEVVPGPDPLVIAGVVILWTVLVTTPVVKSLEDAEEATE